MANAFAAVAFNYMIAQLPTVFVYGIYLPVFVTSYRILLRRAKRNTSTPKFLLIISTLVFCSTTTYFFAIMIQCLKWFANLRDVYPENAIAALSFFIQSSWPVDVITLILATFNFTAGNSVLVWRASILWKRQKWIPIMLWGLLFLQSAVSCAAFINQAIILSRTDGRDTTSYMNLYIPAMFISLVVNLVATLFVVVQTWEYRQAIQQATMHRTSAFSLLYLLVECGFCLSSIQLIYAILTIVRASHSPPQWTSLPLDVVPAGMGAPIAPFFVILAAMCPCLIILLTARHDNIIKAYTRTRTTAAGTGGLSPSKMQALGGIRTTTVTEIDFAPRKSRHGGGRILEEGQETELTEVTEVGSAPCSSDIFGKEGESEYEIKSRFSESV